LRREKQNILYEFISQCVKYLIDDNNNILRRWSARI